MIRTSNVLTGIGIIVVFVFVLLTFILGLFEWTMLLGAHGDTSGLSRDGIVEVVGVWCKQKTVLVRYPSSGKWKLLDIDSDCAVRCDPLAKQLVVTTYDKKCTWK